MNIHVLTAVASLALDAGLLATAADRASAGEAGQSGILAGRFLWTAGPPVLEPGTWDGQAWVSVKDPSAVRYDGRWHLFCTVRGRRRTHATVYLSFERWEDASKATPRIISAHDGYFCAPQVFYFSPRNEWYLICQASDDSWEPKYQPAWSRTRDVGSPDSWSKVAPLFKTKPAEVGAWLDFWVICDDAHAHLFFTSLDGRMWRAQTSLGQFPEGWSDPVVVLQGDVFEASHTYRLRGLEKYLTLIEAQNGRGWRYYKAYIADRLDGQWRPLAAEKDHAFASIENVEQPAGRWTDVVSHGELLRVGYDEKLEVDPDHLRFLIQGVLDKDRQGKGYGDIPWRLGILEAATPR